MRILENRFVGELMKTPLFNTYYPPYLVSYHASYNAFQAIKRSGLSNPDHDQSILQEIERKIQTKQQQLASPDSFSNVKAISR